MDTTGGAMDAYAPGPPTITSAETKNNYQHLQQHHQQSYDTGTVGIPETITGLTGVTGVCTTITGGHLITGGGGGGSGGRNGSGGRDIESGEGELRAGEFARFTSAVGLSTFGAPSVDNFGYV